MEIASYITIGFFGTSNINIKDRDDIWCFFRLGKKLLKTSVYGASNYNVRSIFLFFFYTGDYFREKGK